MAIDDKAQPADEAVTPAESVAAETPAGGAAEAAPELAELQSRLAEAQTKAAENWDKLLRLQAELDNQRRRLERDVENAHKFALEKFALELLPVRDSLERGLDAAGADAAEVAALRDGMTLTLKMLSAAMDKFGIREVNPAGQPFNPEFHEAMTMVPTTDVDPGCVAVVIQKGYTLNDRLLRAAMVMVAQAPA